MANSLDELVEQGVLSEVVARLKSGKEADVYLVRYAGNVVAAKVYKDRAQRSFKNNASYKEGRTVRNSRSQRAIDRGSKFGKQAEEEAWKASEVNTLYKLHAAGVRTPEPILFIDGVLLMELVRGADGEAAPRLIDVELSEEQATAAYHDMLTQLVRILSCDLIHGDLSPYNVLWGARGATIIDFPQSISAAHNNASESFFIRDARNILGYFATLAPALRARSRDANEIWRAYVRRELTPDFVPTGRAPEGPPARGPHPQGRPGDGRGPGDQRGQQRGPDHRGQQRGPDHRGQQRGPDHRGQQQRGPGDQRGQQRGPDHRGQQQRGPGEQRGQQQRGPGDQRGQQRGPGDQRGQQRGPGDQRGQQRGPDHRGQQQRGPGDQRGQQRWQADQRGSDAPRGAPSAHQGRPGRPRAPEVIVMSRRVRPDDGAPPPRSPDERGGEPRSGPAGDRGGERRSDRRRERF